MGKYYVDRVDGKDNSDELYVVIRVDLDAKDVFRNRQAVKKFCKILKNSNKTSSRNASRDIKKFIKNIESNEKKCPSCKGRGDFEISAGSHSYFSDCDNCKGKGVIKK